MSLAEIWFMIMMGAPLILGLLLPHWLGIKRFLRKWEARLLVLIRFLFWGSLGAVIFINWLYIWERPWVITLFWIPLGLLIPYVGMLLSGWRES